MSEDAAYWQTFYQDASRRHADLYLGQAHANADKDPAAHDWLESELPNLKRVVTWAADRENPMTRDELRNAINNACDIVRREGLTRMDYMEQPSWLLFLSPPRRRNNEVHQPVKGHQGPERRGWPCR